MDVLDVKKIHDDKETSSNSCSAAQNSLVMDSRVVDGVHSEESNIGKRNEEKQHRTQSDKYDEDYDYGRRRDGERYDSRKNRRRSRSSEDDRVHHRSREGSSKWKKRRSRSRSRKRSPQRSPDNCSDHSEKTRTYKERESYSDKTELLRSKSEISSSMLNGDQADFDRQSNSDKRYERKGAGGHSRFKEDSGSKEKSRPRSPCSEAENPRTRSPNTRPDCDERDEDLVQNRRHKMSSPELSREDVSKDRGSRSNQRHHRRRSKSRSRSRSRYNRHYESVHRNRRSHSRSRDTGRSRNWERSENRNDDIESRAERRPRSRTRSRERKIRENSRASNSEDGQKRIYEEDEPRRKYFSKSYSKHESRNHDARDLDSKQGRESGKDFSNSDERSSDAEYLKRRRSRSPDRNWSSYSGKAFNHRYNSNRGERWNSGSRGEGREREDGRMFQENFRGNFRQNKQRIVGDSTDNGRDSWDSGRKRDWRDSRQQHEVQRTCDDGQQLEDMVVKSLAKLRQDSDKEQHPVNDNSSRDASDQENRCSTGQDRTDDDHSTIPVLLSKKSVFGKNDVANNYDQAIEHEDGDCKNSRTDSFTSETAIERQLHSSRDGSSRHPTSGHSRFQGDFQHSAPPPRFEFQGRGRPRLPPPRGMIPGPPLGVRLPPGMVQPGVLVAPFHLRPPAIQEIPRPVDWRMIGPMGAHPSPPIGPGRPLLQVGAFIRTQVPVEFLTGPPPPAAAARFSHPPPFQPGLPPPLSQSMPPGHHPGVPLPHLPIRAGDPLHMQQPVTLMHPHHIRMPSPELRQRLVNVHNLGPLHAIVSSHPPPTSVNIGIPPPPLPVRMTVTGEMHPGFGFPVPSQSYDPNASSSSSTPPPPPPPATVSVGLLDPRLNPVKPFSQQQLRFAVQHSPSSTSDESIRSDLSEERRGGKAANESMIQSRSPGQSGKTSERPHSTSSLGSNYSPQHITDDAYAEALFEDPYHHPSDDADAQIMSHVPEKSLTLSGASQPTVASIANDIFEASATALNNVDFKLVDRDEDPAMIPEIFNPMESPNDDREFAKKSSPSDSTNTLHVSARTLDMIQVSDLQKVLETVRTSAFSCEEEIRSQDKLPTNRMDQIAEEVKLALKPHFGKGLINKDEYKDIMRKTVPKIFTSKSNLDRSRIQSFVQEYVNKIMKSRKSDKMKKSSQGHKSPKHNMKVSSKAV